MDVFVPIQMTIIVYAMVEMMTPQIVLLFAKKANFQKLSIVFVN